MEKSQTDENKERQRRCTAVELDRPAGAFIAILPIVAPLGSKNLVLATGVPKLADACKLTTVSSETNLRGSESLLSD
jgi:hypothetical protein